MLRVTGPHMTSSVASYIGLSEIWTTTLER